MVAGKHAHAHEPRPLKGYVAKNITHPVKTWGTRFDTGDYILTLQALAGAR